MGLACCGQRAVPAGEMTMFSQHTIDFLSDLRANNTRDWFEDIQPLVNPLTRRSGVRHAMAQTTAD